MEEKKPRRRFRFSLRALFVAVTVVGVWLGYHFKWIRDRHAVIRFADGARRHSLDLAVARDGRPAGVVAVAPVGVPAPFAQQATAVVGKMAQEVAPFHVVTSTRSLCSAAALAAASRLSCTISPNASRIDSSSSARVRSWQLTPGISSTQPTHQSPSFWIMAV